MKKWLFAAGAVALLAGIEAILGRLDSPYYYRIAVFAGINVILAVSLNLINGFTGQFSIGHAGFYAVGAYTSAFVAYNGQRPIRAALSFLPPLLQDSALLLAGLVAAAVVAAIAGLAVGIPSLRLRGDYLAIVTLGFGEIIRVLIVNIDQVGGARGFYGIPQLSNFFWVYLFAVITIVAVRNLMRSSYGRAFISIRDDEIAAEAMGVNTTRFKVLSFVVSSMFAGIAGSLFGHFTAYLHPNSFVFATSFYMIIMIVIGGLGSIEGAILGAVLVTVALEVFRGFDAYRHIYFSIMLILIMIYRPQGLLGGWTVARKGAAAK